jgi:hypothetical protein
MVPTWISLWIGAMAFALYLTYLHFVCVVLRCCREKVEANYDGVVICRQCKKKQITVNTLCLVHIFCHKCAVLNKRNSKSGRLQPHFVFGSCGIWQQHATRQMVSLQCVLLMASKVWSPLLGCATYVSAWASHCLRTSLPLVLVAAELWMLTGIMP